MTMRLPGMAGVCLMLASAASAQGVESLTPTPSPAERVWLMAERGPARSLAGRRASWLDGAKVELASGVTLGVVDGLVFDDVGAVAAILVRVSANAPAYAVPRAAIHVANAGRVVVNLTPGQALALAPVE